MKVAKCIGQDGPVGPDSVFWCDVAIDPVDLPMTVYAFSSCAISPGPQTIEGRTRLLFRTASRVPAGNCAVTLFMSDDATRSIESSTEATVEVIGESLPKSDGAVGRTK